MLAEALFLVSAAAAPAAKPPSGTSYFVNDGCLIGWIFFDSGSAVIDDTAQQGFRALSGYKPEHVYPGRLKLIGSASPHEADPFRLSSRRAHAVRQHFIELGFAPHRIQVEGVGQRNYHGWTEDAPRRGVTIAWEGPVVKRNQPGVPEVVC